MEMAYQSMSSTPQTFRCPPRQFSPLLQRIDCFNETNTTTADNWQLLTLADVRYNQTLTGSDETAAVGQFVQASTWFTSVMGLTGIACRSSYTIESVNVTYDYSHNPVQVNVARPPKASADKLDGFTDFDLGRLFTASLSAASDIFGNVLDNAYAEEYPDTMFKMMAQVAGGGYQSLLDEPTMIRTAEIVFQQVAVQIINKNLMQSTRIPLMGQASYTQQRLQLNDISLWSMVAGFGLMTGIAVFFFLSREKEAIPRNPESILSAALVLKPSKVLNRILRHSAGCPEDQLAANLQRFTFTTTLAKVTSSKRPFMISVNGSVADLPHAGRDSEMGWWKPLAAHRAVLFATVGTPLAIIAALELIQRKSDSNSGIASVSDAGSLSSKVLTRYLPALVMLLSASLFNSMEFTIAVLAPYNSMRRNSEASTNRKLSSILSLMPPHALWRAGRNRYWGALLATVAALLGSVLTIVSSGLYTIDFVPTISRMQIQTIDTFTTTWSNSVLNDSSAAVLTSLSESLNLTYPRSTYEELALPGLQSTPSRVPSTPNAQSVLSIRLPSLRASLNCTALDSSQYNLTTSYNPAVGPGATIRAVSPLPSDCLLGGSGGNLTTIEFEQSFQFPFTQKSSHVAKLLDLHVGPFDPVHELSEAELSPSTQIDNPPGCPSLGFLYGFVDVNDASRSSASALICYQLMEELPTDVTLVLPGLTIPLESPPTPDESKVKFFTSGPNGETAFEYRIQEHMDKELSLFNQTEYDSSSTGTSTVDRFFQGVLFGKYPIPQAWLGEASRIDEVMSAIQGFYRRYMAQAISANMRVPTLASEAQLVNGTMTVKHGDLRVKQNNTSKLALQILLGVMFVCGTLAVSFSTTREIMPYNPCTIAGVMALWAGSRLSGDSAGQGDAGGLDVPMLLERAEFMSDKELALSGLLDGWSFRLGWWEMDYGSRRYGIDVVRKERD